MASLSGNSISTTYESLVKFNDNAAVSGTLKALTDGAGNTLPLEVSSTGVNFTGTVTGIPGGGLTSVSDMNIVTGTSTGADFVVHSVLIPAGTFGAGDVLDYATLFDYDASNGGFIYYSAWISTSTSLFSGFPIGGGAQGPGTTFMSQYLKYIYIHTTDGSGQGTSYATRDSATYFQTATPGYGQYNDSASTAINWGVDQYINFTAYIDNSGNYVKHLGTILQKMN